MSDDMDDIPEPANLRFLRILVTVLTVVMIVGLLTVVALLVTRLRAEPTTVTAPPELALPEGARPIAVTQGPGWWAVVTEDSRILVFDQAGKLTDEVVIATRD